jgi:hypothetical protein
MTEETEKPTAKPVDTTTPAPQQSGDTAPKAQFQPGDHKISARDAAPGAEHTAQFQASDHKIAIKASNDKIQKTIAPESKPKE